MIERGGEGGGGGYCGWWLVVIAFLSNGHSSGRALNPREKKCDRKPWSVQPRRRRMFNFREIQRHISCA
jgi:hypothetical protein